MGLWDDLKSFGSSVGKWEENLFSGVENTFKWAVGETVGVVEHTESTFSGIISTPLLLIAGGIALFLWNSNAGQVAQVTKNVGAISAI